MDQPKLRLDLTDSAPGSPGSDSSTLDVPGSPSSLFDEDTISLPCSRDLIPEPQNRSTLPAHRRGFSTCSLPLDEFHFDSSTVNGQILGRPTSDAGSLHSPSTSSDRQGSSWTTGAERGMKNIIRSSLASLDVFQEDRGKNMKGLRQRASEDRSPSKKRKVEESDDKNGHNSMFLTLSEAEDSSEEETCLRDVGKEPEVPKTKKGVSKIIKKPNIKKAGQASRQSSKSASDADERKIMQDFRSWAENEGIRKGGAGKLDPAQIYRDVRKLLAAKGKEDKDSNHTAAQATLVILSLGSTEAIVDLKGIIKEMRGWGEANMRPNPLVRYGVGDTMLLVVRLVFDSSTEGTPLDNFQMRYFVARLWKFVKSLRKILLRTYPEESKTGMERRILAGFIEEAYPNIVRFRNKQTKNRMVETPEFKAALGQLQRKVTRGYRWLSLKKKFGLGIMAVYYHSKLFSETAQVSLDDHDMSEEEFDLVSEYLAEVKNPHTKWLVRLCKKITAHVTVVTLGVTEYLTQPELFLERWEVKQIMACQEQSAWLSMMCETEDSIKERPRNRVTSEAWMNVDRTTTLSVWRKEVEQGLYDEVLD